MSEAIKCDRCGKLEAKSSKYNTYYPALGANVGLHRRDELRGPDCWWAIDLCVVCRDSLAKWLEG